MQHLAAQVGRAGCRVPRVARGGNRVLLRRQPAWARPVSIRRRRHPEPALRAPARPPARNDQPALPVHVHEPAHVRVPAELAASRHAAAGARTRLQPPELRRAIVERSDTQGGEPLARRPGRAGTHHRTGVWPRVRRSQRRPHLRDRRRIVPGVSRRAARAVGAESDHGHDPQPHSHGHQSGVLQRPGGARGTRGVRGAVADDRRRRRAPLPAPRVGAAAELLGGGGSALPAGVEVQLLVLLGQRAPAHRHVERRPFCPFQHPRTGLLREPVVRRTLRPGRGVVCGVSENPGDRRGDGCDHGPRRRPELRPGAHRRALRSQQRGGGRAGARAARTRTARPVP